MNPPPPDPPQPTPTPVVVAEASDAADPQKPFIDAGMDAERVVFVETFDLTAD
jgi:hypothetical protein